MIRSVQVPQDVAERIDHDRSIVLANMLRVISIAGFGTVSIWAISFRDARDTVFLELILAAGGVNYLILFHKSDRWVRVNAKLGDPAKYLRDMFGLLLGQGLIWAVASIAMMHVAAAQQFALVYAGLVVGMSTAMLLSPRSVAMAFWVPVAIGATISLFYNQQPFSAYALLCLIFYVGMTSCAAMFLSNWLTAYAISAIRVEENAEVIKLLLHDFEENTSDWLWETDANLQMRHISARLAEVAARPLSDFQGTFPDVLLGGILEPDRRPVAALAKLSRYIRERAPFRDLVIPVIVNGEERSWQLTGKPILDKSGEFAGYHGVGSDVTAARRDQEQIAFLAHHDSLTKLPNRVVFNETLHLGCVRCEETGLALLCLDLDDFKAVNDSMGHATGDALLIAVSERIRGCIREGDTAARLGGDEFAIILMTGDMEEVTAVARRLIEQIGRPYHFDGRLLEMAVSIGVTMAPKDGDSPSVLLKNADLALYRAKADGRATWRFYDLQMDERARDRRSLQTDLRQALARGEFYLNFQPILDLETGRIVAAEALLRWVHPERGQLSPAEFIPMAEGAGLIAPIGAWALRQACAVAAGWPEDIRLAVNLSPLQFRDARLLADIDHALTATGFPPARLELEITETTLLETSKQTTEALRELHKRGIGIALDDFGTGYSSLGYLRRFPFDKIKIDRSFIRDLGREKDDASIILAIIGLAANMNLVVTAEGVETEEQAKFLLENGCAQAQGFLFHPPLSADQFSSLLGAGRDGVVRVRSAAE